MLSFTAVFCVLATIHLLVHNVASVPAPWPHYTQEGFEQEISQVSHSIEQAVAASGSRSKRASRVSSSDVTIAPIGLALLTDTARCRLLIENMKQFWTLCYGMNMEYGGASLTCLRGPSMARSALQMCARVVEGQDFDDLVKYAIWLKDLKDEITTIV